MRRASRRRAGSASPSAKIITQHADPGASLWVYYVLPIVFSIRIESLTALIIGLSLYQGAFISEVYRSGIQSVPRGHSEAAQVLGLIPLQSFIRIVFPQAIRMTLPPLDSNFVQLIKYSSLGAVISVSEITRRGMELSASNFRRSRPSPSSPSSTS